LETVLVAMTVTVSKVDSTEISFAEWWCDLAFSYRFAWVSFLHTAWLMQPSFLRKWLGRYLSPWWAGYCCVCCSCSPGRSSVFLFSVRNYEHVVHASEVGSIYVARPAEGSLLKVLHEETGDHW
jgi:hypothetical protein